MKNLTSEEQALVLQQIVEPRDRAVVLLLLNTGLRVRELCQLRWGSCVETEDGFHLQLGDERRLPLNQAALDALDLLGRTKPECLDTEFVLTGLRGQPNISVRAVQQMLKKYASSAEVDKVTPMALRHTFSQRIVNSNNAQLVAELTDRTPISTAQYQSTEDASLEALREAVNMLAE